MIILFGDLESDKFHINFVDSFINSIALFWKIVKMWNIFWECEGTT